MDINDILNAHETRIQSLEATAREHSARLGKVEDKTDSAWHRIRETQEDISKLDAKVDELDRNVKDVQKGLVVVNEDVKVMKSQQKSDSIKMKVILALVSVSLVISIGFFIYIWRHDRELAKELLSFGVTFTKTVAV